MLYAICLNNSHRIYENTFYLSLEHEEVVALIKQINNNT